MLNLSLWKDARKRLGLTLEDVARLSGISISTIKDIFRGATTDPRIETVQAIERVLGLSPSEWTEEEKAAGVGAHGVKLSEAEWNWLELRSAIIEAKGERGLHAVETIIKTFIEKK